MTKRTFYSHSLSEATKDACEFIDKLDADQFMGVHAGRGHPTKGDVRYVTIEFSGDDPSNVNATKLKEADMKDQSHDDLLKRYVNLSQENLRLKLDLTKITRDRDELHAICTGINQTLQIRLKPIGDA